MNWRKEDVILLGLIGLSVVALYAIDARIDRLHGPRAGCERATGAGWLMDAVKDEPSNTLRIDKNIELGAGYGIRFHPTTCAVETLYIDYHGAPVARLAGETNIYANSASGTMRLPGVER